MARDARAFLAQRLFRNLNDDFLALLQHVRNQLRTAGRLRTVMALAVLRAPAAVVAASAISLAAATRGVLHARTEIVAYTRLERLSRGLRIFAGDGRHVVRGCLGFELLSVFLGMLALAGRRDHSFGFRVGFFLLELGVFAPCFVRRKVALGMIRVGCGVFRRIFTQFTTRFMTDLM